MCCIIKGVIPFLEDSGNSKEVRLYGKANMYIYIISTIEML